MKRLLLILLLFLSLFSFTSVSANSKTEKISEKEIKQAESLWHYQNLLKSAKLYANFDDEFGGVYLNAEGKIVINIVAGKKDNFIDSLKVSEEAIIVEVDYSLKEINNEQERIGKLYKELNIVSIGRSEKLNTLIITIDGNFDENKKTIEQSSSLNNLVVVQKNPIGSIEDTASYTTNGEYTNINNLGYSVGFAARNSSGDPGFVTAGHSLSNGDDAYCDSSHCGDVNGCNNDGDVDASFIKLRTGWLPTKNFMNGDSYSSAQAVSQYVVVGTSLSAYGATSGKELGEILDASFDFLSGGTWFTDFVQADYVAIGGDSGAAVTYWIYIGTGIYLRTVMSIQGKSNLVNLQWVDGTSFSLSSKVNNIYDELNLSGY